jgi:hypothetical protein
MTSTTTPTATVNTTATVDTTPTATVDTTTVAAAAIDSFLRAIGAGQGIPASLFSPEARVDATVPNWRFTVAGRDAIAAEYSRWFADPASFQELSRSPIEGGEVVTYLLTWTDHDVPHAAHHCHTLKVDSAGLISEDTVFCGGRWSASLLAEMAVFA